MLFCQHRFTGFPCAARHNQVFISFIVKVDLSMIVAEGIVYLIYHLGHQFLPIKNCGKTTAYLSGRGKRFGTVCHALFQPAEDIFQLRDHAVE